jgi:hypothetical protein
MNWSLLLLSIALSTTLVLSTFTIWKAVTIIFGLRARRTK